MGPNVLPTSFRASLTGGREIVDGLVTVEKSILPKWAVPLSKSKNNRLPKRKAKKKKENLCTYDTSYKTSEAILEVAWCCWAQLWSLYKVSDIDAKNHCSHPAVNNGLFWPWSSHNLNQVDWAAKTSYWNSLQALFQAFQIQFLCKNPIKVWIISYKPWAIINNNQSKLTF